MTVNLDISPPFVEYEYIYIYVLYRGSPVFSNILWVRVGGDGTNFPSQRLTGRLHQHRQARLPKHLQAMVRSFG